MTHARVKRQLGGTAIAAMIAASVGSPGAQEGVSPAAAGNSGDKLATKCEYGVTLALSGETDAAEKVFTSLLSESPGDARAYTNLGNLNFLRGELEVALVFYDKGIGADAEDPGILLNRATTLMLLGDDAAARSTMATAVEKAGGAEQLAGLISLDTSSAGNEPDESDKASEKTYVSREEVGALIAGAMQSAGSATSDSLATHEHQAVSSKKRARLWRSSGPKAADDTEAALVLYWKQ